MKVMLNYPVIRFVLFVVCSLMLTNEGFAQKKPKGSSVNNCQLDEAKKWYEEGELEKIEDIESCVNNPKSMSREKRIEGLQLLTESYLYRDKIGAADKTFRNLLRINPLYEADSTREDVSYDLVYLSRTFNRRPIVSMTFGVGATFTLVESLRNYSIVNTGVSQESFLSTNPIALGFTANIGVVIPLIYNFELGFEVNYAYRTYSYYDSMYVSANTSNPSSTTLNSGSELNKGGALLPYSILKFQENQHWIDLPLTLRYNVTKFKNVLPYIYVGGAPNFLLSADVSNISRETIAEPTGGGRVVQSNRIFLTEHENPREPTEKIASVRTMYNISFIAGAGLNFRIGSNFFFVDFRYTRMFLNNVAVHNRYQNTDLWSNFEHVDNDFRMDNFALTIGFSKAFYKPRKKRQHNPIIINNKYNRWLEKERNYVKRETDEDLKRELNSAIKEMERQKPSLIEDVQQGREKGAKMLSDKQKELEDIKNKKVKVEIKYE